jgi:CHAT domain-containing protein
MNSVFFLWKVSNIHSPVHTSSSKGRDCLKALVAVCLLSPSAYALEGHQSTSGRTSPDSAGHNNPGETQLIPHRSFTRKISGGQAHVYTIRLEAGECLRTVVEQQGIDLIVTLINQESKVLAVIDRPNGWHGPEGITIIANLTGNYRLSVEPANRAARPGRYSLSAKRPSPAQPNDHLRNAAEITVSEGERARAKQNIESVRKAIEQFTQALNYWRKLRESYEEAVVLYGLGLCYRHLGENQTAVTQFSNAQKIMHGLGNRYGQAFTQTGLGWAYFYLGAIEEAREAFSTALKNRRAVDDSVGEAITLFGLGWVYLYRQEYQTALEIFLQSHEVRRRLGDRPGEAVTSIGIGQLYNRLGRPQEAQPYLHRAISIARDNDDRFLQAHALDGLGWASLGLDLQSEVRSRARGYFEEALLLRRSAGDRSGESIELFGLARVAQREGRLLEALDHINASISAGESSRATVLNPQLRTSYFTLFIDRYKFAVRLLMDLHEQNPSDGYAALAWQMCERSRARSLLDLLEEAKAETRTDTPSTMLKREHDLRQEINILAEKQWGRGKLNSWDSNRLNELVGAYEDLQGQIRSANPRFAALTHPVPLSLAELQNNELDADTLLLEYSLDEDSSYLWAITQGSFMTYRLPGQQDIASAVWRFREALEKARTTELPVMKRQRHSESQLAQTDLREAAELLTKLLLAPVAEHLKKKRLVIVSDGPLLYVPFAALLIPSDIGVSASEGSASNTEYLPLVVEHEIVNLPSASVLASLRRQVEGRAPAPESIAVFADPVYDVHDPRIRRAAELARRRAEVGHLQQSNPVTGRPGSLPPRLLRLPFTRREATAIIAHVPDRRYIVALDFAANRTMALSDQMSRYRIIHFATHSFLDERHPQLSGIALSLLDERGDPQNGFLWLNDIYNLNLNADLVVLSACRTGLGKEVRGEGFIGLTRGFMYAGAPRVIATLWKVDDRATAELMGHFYRELFAERGKRPAQALRAAQLEMWRQKRWRNPVNWAAFVLEGEWR